MKNLGSTLACLGLLAGLTACDQPEVPTATPKSAPRVEGEHITLPPESGTIETQRVERQGPLTLHIPGRLVWNEEQTARVFPPFAGRVKEILAKLGDRVTAGQPLAMIEAPDFGVAQNDFRRAEAAFALAQKQLDRINVLFQHGISSRKEIEQARTDLAHAQSEIERTRARLASYGLSPGTVVDQRFPLKSPIAGVVVERTLNPGQEVDAAGSEALFVVSDPLRLWAILDVPEKELADIRLKASFSLAVRAYPGERFSGTVDHISDFIDPKSRTIKVRGDITDPTRRLKAEMFVNAELDVNGEHGLRIPEQAAVLIDDTYYVFVADADHRFHRQTIETGPSEHGELPVRAGLAIGERVVTHDALFLQQLLQSARNRQ
jgi:membrane fusion protein, heavy metal efflux system